MQPGVLPSPAAVAQWTRHLRVGIALMMPLLLAFIVSACGDTASTVAPATPTAVLDAQVHVTTTVPPNQQVPDPVEVNETTAAGVLPAFLGKAVARIKPLYQGALDHGDVYAQMPCYCGCALYQHAHTSLKSCFIKTTAADGQVNWTDHSTSCDICTGVAQLTLDELAKGTAPKVIREMVHTKFKYTNVWTDTPPIQ